MPIVLVILILVVLIIVHELGHFIAAKLFGVRVEEFGIGYPPTAVSLGRIGETEYTLNWLPFGGFVRLFGDEGQNESGLGSFVTANRAKQAIILLAGIAMNLVAGWVLFTGAYMMGIPRAVESAANVGVAQVPGSRLFIADVVPGSPAEAAGIRGGDELVVIADQSGAEPTALSPAGVSEFVGSRGGKKLDVSYVRANATSSVGLIPANAIVPNAPQQAAIGVDLVLVTSAPLPFIDASQEAAKASYGAFVAVGQNVLSIIRHSFAGALNLQGIVGPVGLVSVVGEASKAGFGQVLWLAAFISVNLAVINLVPIPLLDGGRLVVVALESAIRRRAPKLVIHLLNTVGILAVLCLMVIVTYHDIARLVA